jgi:hypothetical protein
MLTWFIGLTSACSCLVRGSAGSRGTLRTTVSYETGAERRWAHNSPGFACQGNEFSHYMLLASFFILNRSAPPSFSLPR